MKVLVGLSGGVDSAVCAYLLKERGMEVLCASLIMHNSDKLEAELRDAKKIAEDLALPFVEIDGREAFDKTVKQNFVDEYIKGRTPNPCCICNPKVKFKLLYEAMKEYSCDKFATGHYAKVVNVGERKAVAKGESSAKDQAYALYRLSQDILASLLLPLGEYEKSRIREIAREQNISVCEKADSNDICFIEGSKYSKFILDYVQGENHRFKVCLGEEQFSEPSWNTPGRFVDKDGKPLGWHEGIIHYTIGQRRGLKFAAGERVYVKSINPITNEIMLVGDKELYTRELYCRDLVFQKIEDLDLGEKLQCNIKIRYRTEGVNGFIEKIQLDKIRIICEQPVRAVTPGQSAVFYDDEGIVIGGGIIE